MNVDRNCQLQLGKKEMIKPTCSASDNDIIMEKPKTAHSTLKKVQPKWRMSIKTHCGRWFNCWNDVINIFITSGRLETRKVANLIKKEKKRKEKNVGSHVRLSVDEEEKHV